MRRTSSHIAIALSTLLLISICSAQQTSTTAVPSLIRYGGVLKDGQGAAISSHTVGVTFLIYKQQDGGAPVWLETQNVTLDASGRYSVLLGSATATGLPSDLFSPQEERWLAVKMEGQPEQPRILLVSVPYALKAAEADTLAGHSASEFVTTDNLQSAVKQQLQQQTAVVSPALQGAGGSLYINNGTTLQTGAYFNIDGSGSVGGAMQANSFNVISTTSNQAFFSNGVPFLGTGNPADWNTFLGISAGLNNVAGKGTSNVFLGKGAGYNNTTGSLNAFVGAFAGFNNTTGQDNIFNGYGAGYNNTTGIFNVFNGNLTGYKNTTGSYNAYTGLGAGYYNTTGGNNTYTGYHAGINATGSYNTFSGQSTGANNTTGNSNLYLANMGCPSPCTESNTIRIGTQGIGSGQQNTTYIAGINGAATSSGVPVFIDSTGKLGTMGGSLGDVTSFNGRSGAVLPALGDYSFSLLSGTLANAQLSGSYSSAVTLSSTGNAFMGNGAGLTNVNAATLGGNGPSAFAPATGSTSYIQNGSAMQGTAAFNIGGDGSANSFNSASTYQIGGGNVVGIGSLTDDNLFLGIGAGNSNVAGSGQENLFSGYQAGYSNDTGANNVFDGTQAGYSNTNGSNNVFSGFAAGYKNTTSDNNVFSGFEAGFYNTGDNNVFVGYEAGAFNTTGFDNTFLGNFAGGSNTTGNSDVYIANVGLTSGTESHTIRIGSQGAANGQQNTTYIAGIYGNAPAAALPVVVNANGQLGTTTAGIGVTSFNGRTGAVVPAANDYNFSQVNGVISPSQVPTNLSAYIQNGTATQTGANFNIDGNGTIGGLFTANNGVVGVNNVPLNAAVTGHDNVTSGGGSAGVEGKTQNPAGVGVYGRATSATGLNIGMQGESDSSTGAGVLGVGGSTTGVNYGVLGYSGSSSGFGVVGSSQNVGTAGITQTCTAFGTCTLSNGIAGQFATMTGGTILQGESGSSLSTLATVFSVDSSGNITAAGVPFKSVMGGVAVNVDSGGHLGVTTSSRRFKEDIADMGDRSSKLFQLRPVTFFYKPQYDDGSHQLQYGLIAEEVAKVLPELVAYDKDGQPYTVKYQYLAPMLLNELQKQHAAVAAQQDVIQTLQNQNAEMEQRISRLEKLLLQQAQ